MTLLFFGRLADSVGRRLDIALPPQGCTVAALRARLAADHPELAAPGVRACIDQIMVGEAAMVRDGQEVAFVPPLSGG